MNVVIRITAIRLAMLSQSFAVVSIPPKYEAIPININPKIIEPITPAVVPFHTDFFRFLLLVLSRNFRRMAIIRNASSPSLNDIINACTNVSMVCCFRN
jgi:hypothetical protein